MIPPAGTTARARRGARNHAAGTMAEDSAAAHYSRLGGRILARRWRCEWGEIDLIVAFGDEVVFIEVKSRMPEISDGGGTVGGDESLDAIRRQLLRRLLVVRVTQGQGALNKVVVWYLRSSLYLLMVVPCNQVMLCTTL